MAESQALTVPPTPPSPSSTAAQARLVELHHAKGAVRTEREVDDRSEAVRDDRAGGTRPAVGVKGAGLDPPDPRRRGRRRESLQLPDVVVTVRPDRHAGDHRLGRDHGRKGADGFESRRWSRTSGETLRVLRRHQLLRKDGDPVHVASLIDDQQVVPSGAGDQGPASGERRNIERIGIDRTPIGVHRGFERQKVGDLLDVRLRHTEQFPGGVSLARARHREQVAAPEGRDVGHRR